MQNLYFTATIPNSMSNNKKDIDSIKLQAVTEYLNTEHLNRMSYAISTFIALLAISASISISYVEPTQRLLSLSVGILLSSIAAFAMFRYCNSIRRKEIVKLSEMIEKVKEGKELDTLQKLLSWN